MNSQKKKICVVTSGHMASTPRMLKAADAFHEAGYEVRMVCAEQVDWCIKAGINERAKRSWKCRVVDWHPVTGKGLYHWSRLRHYFYRKLNSFIGPDRIGLTALVNASSRVGPEILNAILEEPFDFLYAGTAGGIGIGALAAQIANKPYALDLEDFHSDELEGSAQALLKHRIIKNIEKRTCFGARFLTAGSKAIAFEYKKKYGFIPEVINNVFKLPKNEPSIEIGENGLLKIIWFSQTLGHGRGLESFLETVALMKAKVQLTLRGTLENGFDIVLKKISAKSKGRLNLEIKKARFFKSPEQICVGYDIGLSLEQGQVRNREICLSNKPLTYLLAGLAVVLTDTEGQREFGLDMGLGAILFQRENLSELARKLDELAFNPGKMLVAKRTSWVAAKRRWHWEHPEEKGKLLNLINTVFK